LNNKNTTNEDRHSALVPIREELLRELQVTLEARLGEKSMTVAELMALKAGDIIPLDRSLADHVELYLNGTLVAYGEIVAVEDKFGIRIVEIGAEGQ